MATPARWTDVEFRGLSTLFTDCDADRAATEGERQIAARRRAIFAETIALSELTRYQAVLRWRGLAPDSHAQ